MCKFCSKLAIVAVTVALFAVATSSVMARGGGHGGGHGGGGFHGGGHANHPFHPSQHHIDHHNADHNHHADYNHHHHVWHRGGWGPGYWGGAALGYGLAYGGYGYGGYGNDGDNTYIDNTSDVSTTVDNSDDNGDDEGNDENYTNNTPISNGNRVAVTKAPFDDWPELGIVTYAGQYGGTLGQVVVRVVPNSAAAKAGIIAGDVILSLNGQPTPSADSVEAILENANVQFTAEVWDARTGRKSTLSGTLDPNAPATGKTAAAEQR